MSMNTPTRPPPTAEEQLRAWNRVEEQLGVRGPEAVLEMVRSLEEQLVALYTELDEGETR
jgi:hypothetical protein